MSKILTDKERWVLIRALTIYKSEWNVTNANIEDDDKAQKQVASVEMQIVDDLQTRLRDCIRVELVIAEVTQEPAKKEHPPITPEQKYAMITALETLCSYDGDMAQELNGVGFNKHDTTTGHSLFKSYKDWGKLTDKQYKLLIIILRKYKRQISEDVYNVIYPQPTDADLAKKALED